MSEITTNQTNADINSLFASFTPETKIGELELPISVRASEFVASLGALGLKLVHSQPMLPVGDRTIADVMPRNKVVDDDGEETFMQRYDLRDPRYELGPVTYGSGELAQFTVGFALYELITSDTE